MPQGPLKLFKLAKPKLLTLPCLDFPTETKIKVLLHVFLPLQPPDLPWGFPMYTPAPNPVARPALSSWEL